MAELSDALAPLAFLVGSWGGSGRGIYPTIDDFEYEEEVTFEHVGKPWLAYAQQTWHAFDGRALHAERGFLRLTGPEALELVVAHSPGQIEVSEGRLRGSAFELRSVRISQSTTSKPVDEVLRRVRVEDGTLFYELEMAFGGNALQNHLRAELRKRD